MPRLSDRGTANSSRFSPPRWRSSQSRRPRARSRLPCAAGARVRPVPLHGRDLGTDRRSAPIRAGHEAVAGPRQHQRRRRQAIQGTRSDSTDRTRQLSALRRSPQRRSSWRIRPRAANPSVAFRAAGLFWSKKGLNEAQPTSRPPAAFKEITRRINGGTNGLAERQAFYAVARKVLGVADTPRSAAAREPRAPMPTDEPTFRARLGSDSRPCASAARTESQEARAEAQGEGRIRARRPPRKPERERRRGRGRKKRCSARGNSVPRRGRGRPCHVREVTVSAPCRLKARAQRERPLAAGPADCRHSARCTRRFPPVVCKEGDPPPALGLEQGRDDSRCDLRRLSRQYLAGYRHGPANSFSG